MNRTLNHLLLAALLTLPLAATADDDDDDDDFVAHGAGALHLHGHDCHQDHGPGLDDHRHAPPPPVVRHGEGRYELRTVRQWVSGRYEEVWVPGVCRENRHGRVRCTSGYYDRRYVPGRYESVQQWVWVAPRDHDVPPRPPRPLYGRFGLSVEL